MTPDTRNSVPTRSQPALDASFNAPVALSFTRFVAAHGGSESLRLNERPPQTPSLNPLTFTRLPWLASRVPGRADANGETV